MKLMLRPEWRLWPLSSFLGLLDLKTGVTVALLFALLNKVAGVYGLIAVLTGAGGSFAQLSLYIYSAVALAALAWGLRVVHNEDAKKTLYFAHLFFADHIFSTSWTIFFAVGWWLWNPHDGRRQANSAAQEAVMKLANSSVPLLTDEQRKEAAMAIWNHEKGLAAAVIIISWMFKIYFALLLYSYAVHLRKGSYRSLPLSRYASVASNTASHAAYDVLADAEDEEIEDFYRVPLRTPPASGHRRGGSSNNNGSVATFADFVSAPGRTPRKTKFGSVSLPRDGGIDEEVIFDEDEVTYAASTSSRAQSKLGTDSSTTAASDEERGTSGSGSDTGKGRFTREK
ncbi:Inositolphosphorylceramide synthase subunit Kei1-domain-containing protein [Gymnopilus junonius]|uniref:Inositolphosphorylceramide synthase subunit Kei1-domain-containing protein n=1 Tax=Gymnopilus junonius TaxID=109634 RepID=A0A9P5NZ07_GYMJU|nr:Inositolphosphorylceramide synthase subunit Kei1-domain-containing protein [Gymnopilus junonius]